MKMIVTHFGANIFDVGGFLKKEFVPFLVNIVA